MTAGTARAQSPVTRRDVVDAALRRGSRIAFVRSDSLVAEAGRLTARTRPNPTLAAAHSTSTPREHVTLDVPFDAPWQRGPRVAAADSSLAAARARFAFERAAIRFEAEALYARAQAAEARARLTRRTALDADSVLVLARIRRDAGDASELDVELASINAGQMANIAADDSIGRIGALLEVQLAMGRRGDSLEIALADSLQPPADTIHAAFGVRMTLPVVAASASLGAARESLRLERRGRLEFPTLQLGFEASDPAEPGLLPMVGLSMPLPFFDRRRGPIAAATAGLARAEAELALARRESDAEVARAVRERAAALDRVRRDERLIASALRVSQLSLIAYREGAAALPSVLEAARNAREVLARYIDDVAAALTADAALRWLIATWEN